MYRGTAATISLLASFNGFVYSYKGMSTMQISFDAVSVTDAAEIIGCTTGRVRQLLLEGELRGKKLSEKHNAPWLVSRVDAEKLRENPGNTGRPRKNLAG
jgi:hypothetical protein